MSRPGAVRGSATLIAMGLATVLLALLGYSLLIDPPGALAAAREAVVTVARVGVWVALGVVPAVWLRQRGRASWRLALALPALFATGLVLYLRPEVDTGGRLLPSPLSVLGPMAAGAVAASLVRASHVQRWSAGCRSALGESDRLLMATIALVLCLAAPMIWSPVVEHWNASGWMDSHSYDAVAHNIVSGKHPEASSHYMPVYQYGLAAVYYVFGHFFFAQQLINVGLSFLTVVFLCLAAWTLFRNLWAVLLIGVWAASLRQLFYAVHITQIESWYTPIVAFGVYAWTRYWATPSMPRLLLVTLAAAIGINTRNQGAFYFGWLCLAPLFIASLPWRRRVAQAAFAVAILAASLLPWTLRNYAVEGRLSPSAARNAYYVAILNDPRIGLYGVRYWEGWAEIAQEYDRKYPDPVERDRAMMRAGLRTPFENFAWFQRAVFWRALAFYGLLPNGVLATAGQVSINWATEWYGYVYWRTTPLLLLPLSLIGLITRPGRTTLFLTGAIMANVAVVAVGAANEDRVSYPVLPLHMLMALAALFRPQTDAAEWAVKQTASGVAHLRLRITVALCVLVFLMVACVRFGRPNLYAPLVERDLFIQAAVALDETLPFLNDYAATGAAASVPDSTWEGRPVRLRLIASNYQCPPKYGGRISYMPEFATDPARETYYYATLLVSRGATLERLPIAVAWFGATLNQPLREGDEVEAQGQLRLAPDNPIAKYWVRIEKARKVQVRSSEIPAFF